MEVYTILTLIPTQNATDDQDTLTTKRTEDADVAAAVVTDMNLLPLYPPGQGSARAPAPGMAGVWVRGPRPRPVGPARSWAVGSLGRATGVATCAWDKGDPARSRVQPRSGRRRLNWAPTTGGDGRERPRAYLRGRAARRRCSGRLRLALSLKG